MSPMVAAPFVGGEAWLLARFHSRCSHPFSSGGTTFAYCGPGSLVKSKGFQSPQLHETNGSGVVGTVPPRVRPIYASHRSRGEPTDDPNVPIARM